MIRILAACGPGEVRAAAVEDGVVVDYAIHRAGAVDGVGDRMRGRVVAHVAGLAGYFVALPGGSEGFLPDSVAPAGLAAGAAVTVVVTRSAQGSKGPRLSAGTAQEGAGAPALIERGAGAIERLGLLYPDAPITVDDAGVAAGLAAGAAVVAEAWDDDVASQVEALSGPVAALAGGARASIHPTPALVAIDVDTASASAGTRLKGAAQRAINLAALPGLARAIRLRNLSGAIVIDLAGMTPKARAGLGPEFTAALALDPLRPRFLGFTALGLAEILRARTHPPLHELLGSAHGAGLAALRQLARQARAAPGGRFGLRAAVDVVQAIEGDAIARGDLARRTGRPLIMRLDPALPPGRWVMEPIERASLS